jgi:hypothetical protein
MTVGSRTTAGLPVEDKVILPTWGRAPSRHDAGKQAPSITTAGALRSAPIPGIARHSA